MTASKCQARHTTSPEGYLEWHRWAAKQSLTHHQVRCPECGLWSVWVEGRSSPSSGVSAIAEERWHQIDIEGYQEGHDDNHKIGELAVAAACYAVAALPPRGLRYPIKVTCCYNDAWPWKPEHDKRAKNATQADRIRLLAKAGALIAAEIDRLHRLIVQADGAPRARRPRIAKDVT